MRVCVRVRAPQSECSSNSCQRKSGQLAASSVRHCWNTYCSSHLSETACCCGAALRDPHHRNPHLFLTCFLGCKIFWSRTITLTTLLTFFPPMIRSTNLSSLHPLYPWWGPGWRSRRQPSKHRCPGSLTPDTSSSSSGRILRSFPGSPSSGSCLEQVIRETSR